MTAASPTPVPHHPIGVEVYRLILPNTAGAPRLARDFVASLLMVCRHTGLVDDARICVTELVTNAHRHTRTPLIRVEAAVNRGQVTFTVTDEGGPLTGTLTGALGPRRASPEEEHGRGLALVENLALAWGTDGGGPQHPGRTLVWFTLGRPGATP
ncbi:ATP-binding protein [Streptomyces sp. V2I9]|uniref:ATP-binding protein n=1 Tax=Streptomyces sp. V2I9 TaxID=3042304 RepID=UPI00278025C0|nr:ATP-binding protein [Streptomyces sp. V2I9]MDQ0985357.1 anti-sigma regulatory factor (Ser/Thr protein kinase) [Streptomyces sp. V2I9]